MGMRHHSHFSALNHYGSSLRLGDAGKTQHKLITGLQSELFALECSAHFFIAARMVGQTWKVMNEHVNIESLVRTTFTIVAEAANVCLRHLPRIRHQ